MKIHLVSSVLLVLAVPSCEKAKDLLSKVKAAAPKPAAGTTATPATPVSAVQDIGSAEYASFVATPGRLMVVDFHADWCGPCKTLGPVLEQVAGEFPGVVSIGKVNVDQVRDVVRREGVNGIPDVRLYRDGKEVDRFVGAVGAERIRALFQKHSQGLTATRESPADAGAQGTPQPAIQPMKKDWLPPGIERR